MFMLFMFIFHPVKRRCKSPFRYDCRNYRQHHKQLCCWHFFVFVLILWVSEYLKAVNTHQNNQMV